jgi:SNF2 family DNA or RNA helicase
MPVNFSNTALLLNNLRRFFGGVMFHRGKEYFEQNRVKNITITHTASTEKILIEAKVEGSSRYTTSLKFNLTTGDFSQSRCSCPYDWTTCKHASALGISFAINATKLFSPEKLLTHQPSRMPLRLPTLLKIPPRPPVSLLTLPHKKYFPHHQPHAEAIEETQTTKDITKFYSLVIGNRFSLTLDIYSEAKESWVRWPLTPQTILRDEAINLTEAQYDLFTFLRDTRFNTKEASLGTLFQLLFKSNIPLYLNKKSKKNRLTLIGEPAKLKASLGFRSSVSESTAVAQSPVCVLSFNQPLFEPNFLSPFVSEEHILLIREKERTLECHTLSPRLASIVAHLTKTFRDALFFYNAVALCRADIAWEAMLSEDDLLHLNTFIQDASQSLDLTTSLTPDFTFQKHTTAQPTFVVTYDNKAQTLVISAMMDYGCMMRDISLTLYKSMQSGGVQFKTKSHLLDQQYALAMTGKTIHFSALQNKKESEFFKKLSSNARFGFNKKVVCQRKRSQSIASFHDKEWRAIKKLNYPIIFSKDSFDFQEKSFQASVRIDMDADNDWLAFDVDCYCGDDRITLDDLRYFINHKEEFLRTKDGTILKLSNRSDLERFVLMLESFHQNESGKFEGKSYHAPELENIFTHSPHYTAVFEKNFQRFMKEAQNGKPVEKIAIPKHLRHTLRAYQQEGIHWMHFLRKYHFAGILADDMGLGKTIQALALLEIYHESAKPSLVVCPKTLLFNWEDETKKFFPKLKTLVIDGIPKERLAKIQQINQFDLIITSYSSLKKDFTQYEKLALSFQYCFVDEAQFMKNHKTQNAQVLKKIPADYRLALTGTPLENNVSEIWSIFDFLMPGFLGNYASFVRKYQTPIMKHGNTRAFDELRKKVSCFMLRRTKEKVLKELPEKIEQDLSCELEEAQNLLYQDVLAAVKKNVFQQVDTKGFAKSRIHILAGLTKLRQICNHPALLLKSASVEAYESAKLKIFEELIDEIIASGRKVVVFSQFTQMLDILQHTLNRKHIAHLYLSGKTKNRKELVQRFQNDTTEQVFLISLKAGGTGLNLTAADNVIIFDPWWNPSVENQAIDRTHRIGQTKSVNVYRLITRGTIEEKILALQKKKQFLFDHLVSESHNLFQKITWDDIKKLFG